MTPKAIFSIHYNFEIILLFLYYILQKDVFIQLNYLKNIRQLTDRWDNLLKNWPYVFYNFTLIYIFWQLHCQLLKRKGSILVSGQLLIKLNKPVDIVNIFIFVLINVNQILITCKQGHLLPYNSKLISIDQGSISTPGGWWDFPKC